MGGYDISLAGSASSAASNSGTSVVGAGGSKGLDFKMVALLCAGLVAAVAVLFVIITRH